METNFDRVMSYMSTMVYKKSPHNGLNVLFFTLVFLVLPSVSLASADAEQTTLAVYQPEMGEEFILLLREADPAAGEKVFMRKCSSCHDHLKEGGHGKGPHLWNLVPRTAGTIPGFEFSEAMQGSGHPWTLANLDYYLTRTDRAVPGLSMNFRGIRKDSTRADLIKFLWTLSDDPQALP